MAGSRVLRIFRFRLAAPGFDPVLRSVLLPDMEALPGVAGVFAGRRSEPNPDDRIVVSTWTDRDAMVRAVGSTIEDSPFHPELLELSTDRQLTVCEIAFGDQVAGKVPPAVLRLVHGRVRPGELAAYVAGAEHGMAADRAAGHGPIAFYLACAEDDSFRTLSAWPDWSTLEQATGGDYQQPIATRHAERLVEWSADHYEVVPPDARTTTAVGREATRASSAT